MRALLHAAMTSLDQWENLKSTLYETGCWDQNRRGPFPFDITAWQWTSDEMEMVRLSLPSL
jgi:hypothetical protein